MKALMASSGDLAALRDRLVNMRAELIVGLARDELDARGLPVVARIEAAIDALDRSPRRMVVIAPPGKPIRLAFSSRNDTDATQIAIECDQAGRIVATIDHWTDEQEGGEAAGEQPEVVESGTNEGGDPMASCGVALLDGLPQKRQSRSKLSLAQARALELLVAAIEKSGVIPPTNDDIPANAACIEETLWRDYCYQDAISYSDKPNTRQRAFKRAAEALLAKGLIGTSGGLVWITAS